MDWTASPPHTPPVDYEKVLRRFERFAWLMDQAFQIPGTKIRLGLDGLIGLLPIGGDLATGIAQAAFVKLAEQQFDLPKRLVKRMAWNVAIDLLVGAVPILGDVFDIRFKASSRNLTLLKQHLAGMTSPKVLPRAIPGRLPAL
jgi:hypothetical protein